VYGELLFRSRLCVVVQCLQTIPQHPIPNEEFGAKWLERHVTCGLEICRKTSERIASGSISNGKFFCEKKKLSLVILSGRCVAFAESLKPYLSFDQRDVCVPALSLSLVNRDPCFPDPISIAFIYDLCHSLAISI